MTLTVSAVRLTAKVIFVLSDRPLFTRPSLYFSFLVFHWLRLKTIRTVQSSITNSGTLFLLLSSPFLDLPPFLYHHRYNSFVMFIFYSVLRPLRNYFTAKLSPACNRQGIPAGAIRKSSSCGEYFRVSLVFMPAVCFVFAVK